MQNMTHASSRTGADSRQGDVQIMEITKRFGDHVAVDKLSLEIGQGEFLSLLGPSGCGKTTTLRMLAGFEDPDEGEIRISGESVIGVPAHRRNVNTVFQAYALFPHMTVAENVAYGLRQRKVPKREIADRVTEALDMVQMRSFADRKPSKLSGGQQQRIALARALVNRPAVLLLDEPLGALDRKLREEMQTELKLLQQELGTTFIFVTHDQGEALSMSDRIAIMRQGRIDQLADPNTIYSEPANVYVASFIGQHNFVDAMVTAPGTAAAGKTEFRGDRIAKRRTGDAVRIGIRPEFMQLHEVTDAAARVAEPNTVTGRIKSVAHQGEYMQYLVDTETGETLNVHRPTAEQLTFAIGDSARVSWQPDAVRVFDREDADAIRADIEEDTSTLEMASITRGAAS